MLQAPGEQRGAASGVHPRPPGSPSPHGPHCPGSGTSWLSFLPLVLVQTSPCPPRLQPVPSLGVSLLAHCPPHSPKRTLWPAPLHPHAGWELGLNPACSFCSVTAAESSHPVSASVSLIGQWRVFLTQLWDESGKGREAAGPASDWSPSTLATLLLFRRLISMLQPLHLLFPQGFARPVPLGPPSDPQLCHTLPDPVLALSSCLSFSNVCS